MVDGIDKEALDDTMREKPDKDAEERAIKNLLSNKVNLATKMS